MTSNTSAVGRRVRVAEWSKLADREPVYGLQAWERGTDALRDVH